MCMNLRLMALPLVYGLAAFGQEPVVSNVSFTQSPDGAQGTRVDVYYDLAYENGNCSVSATLSKDNGGGFPFPIISATGDIGADVAPGTGKHIVWNVAADYPGESIAQAVIRVTATGTGTGGPYSIGNTTVTYQDPARGNRNVATRIYYPSTTGGQNAPVAGGAGVRFPVIVFGHGFVISIDSYPYIWQNIVPQGYIIVFCNTETGILPNHGRFAQDLAFLVDRMQAEGAASGSRFYQRVAPTSAVMGHSMGGGATVLSVQYSANITTIVPMAAAETNPSAIAAAELITIPALFLAGSQDCVTPPQDHQIPMFEALASDCSYLVTITGGSHCQFAVDSFLCNSAEAIPCLGRTFVDATVQRNLVINTVLPWLDAKLKGIESGRSLFLERLSANSGSGALTYEGFCAFGFSGQSPAGPLDTVAPTVTSVVATTGQTVEVGFSEPMLNPGATTPDNFTISGGIGNLAPSPASVFGSGPFTLTWAAGEMLNGATITVTAAGMQDIVGNPIGIPNAGSSTGIGTLPTGMMQIDDTATPGYTSSALVSLTLSATDPVGVAQMRFSNDGLTWIPADWAAAPIYATAFSGWELEAGDGLKTVYAQYRDSAGNVSGNVISDTILLDTARPTPVISGEDSITNTLRTLTIDFGEPVQGFELNDVSVLNGTAANLQPAGAGSVFTVDVLGSGESLVSVSIAAGVAVDLAGNPNESTAAPFEFLFDSMPPTALITLSAPTPTTANTVSYVVTFSETIGDSFTEEDVALAPGSLPAMVNVAGTGLHYLVILTLLDPDANGTIGFVIADSAIFDAAGNPYGGGASPFYTIHNWSGFTVQPEDARVYTGGSVLFAVDADFGPIPPSFQWRWTDSTMAVNDGPQAPVWARSALVPADSGRYWCEVVYDGVVHVSASATLEVADHLQVASPLVEGQVTLGDSYTFAIATTGGFEPLTYVWRKDGNLIHGADGAVYVAGTLMEFDTGVYTVEVNDALTDAVSSSAYLLVTGGLPASGAVGLGFVAVVVTALGAALSRARSDRRRSP